MALSEASPIRVVLIDDSDDLCLLVKLALDREPDFTVVAEASDGAAGVEPWPPTSPTWCCWTSRCR